MNQPESFEKELASLINKHGRENGSNTPDFLLAEYLDGCLNLWNSTSTKRENWYKKSLYPGMQNEKP